MADYQNIFTQIQVSTAPDIGPPIQNGEFRIRKMGMSKLIGWFGAAQLGPLYLGYLGIASLFSGFVRHRDHRSEYVGLGQLEPHPVRPPAALGSP